MSGAAPLPTPILPRATCGPSQGCLSLSAVPVWPQHFCVSRARRGRKLRVLPAEYQFPRAAVLGEG